MSDPPGRIGGTNETLARAAKYMGLLVSGPWGGCGCEAALIKHERRKESDLCEAKLREENNSEYSDAGCRGTSLLRRGLSENSQGNDDLR